MSKEMQGQERRQAERYHCTGEAEIVVPGNGLRFRGQIANLSATGCFIETCCRLERGTSVEVWMSTEGLPLRVAANLLLRRGNGVGLRFHSLSGRRLEQIRMLIGELERARKPPEQECAGAIAEGECGSTTGDAACGANPVSTPAVRKRGGIWLLRMLRAGCVRSRARLFGRKAAWPMN